MRSMAGVGSDDALFVQLLASNVLVNGNVTVQSDPFSGNGRGIFNLAVQVTGSAPNITLKQRCSMGLRTEETPMIRLQYLGPTSVKVLDERARVTGAVGGIQSNELLLDNIQGVTGVWDNEAGTGTNYFTGGSVDAETGIITLGSAFPNGLYPYGKLVLYKSVCSLEEAKQLRDATTLAFLAALDGSSDEIVTLTAAVTTPAVISVMPPIAPFYDISIIGNVGNGADTRVTLQLVSGVNTRIM